MSQTHRIHRPSEAEACSLWRGLVCVLMAVVMFVSAFFSELGRVPKGLLLKAITRRCIRAVYFVSVQAVYLVGCIFQLLLLLAEGLVFAIFTVLIWHPLLLITTLWTAAQRGLLYSVSARIGRDFVLWFTRPVRLLVQQVRMIRAVIRSRNTERLLLQAYGQKRQPVTAAQSTQVKPKPAQPTVCEMPEVLPVTVWPNAHGLTAQLMTSSLLPLWSLLIVPGTWLVQALYRIRPPQVHEGQYLVSDPPAQAPPPLNIFRFQPPILAPPKVSACLLT